MKYLAILLLSIFVISSAANATTVTTTTNCQSLSCLRKQIDIVDKQIVDLLGLRLSYVKKAGELKKNRKSIHDCAREKEILDQVKIQAINQGYPGEIAEEVFKTILLQSNAYEKKYHQFHN